MSKKLRGIVISGPTGVGKTDLSVLLAERLQADIISADASQVYRKMDIGTGKITEKEMRGIRHYMIDIADPGEDYTVADFERDVNKILSEKEEDDGKDGTVLLAGGTGLYIRSVTDGLSELPSKDENIRAELGAKSTEELQEILKSLDEKAYSQVDLFNRIRLIRAIEVCLLTGGKFSELREANRKNNSYSFLKVFLTRSRDELYERINRRVDRMIEQGLIDEVKRIYMEYSESLYRINSIGYKELFAYFDGKSSLEEAVEKIKQESRRYAKRQMTWFRKEKDYIVYNLSEMSEEQIIEDILKKWRSF